MTQTFRQALMASAACLLAASAHAATQSANDATVTTVGPAIVDASGNSYTITSNGQVAFNRRPIYYTANVVELAYVNGVVWQENSAGNWYSFSKNGTGEASGPTKTSPLPVSSTPAPTPAPTPTPTPTPAPTPTPTPAPAPAPTPAPAPAPAGTGQFHVSNGQIIGPSGAPFLARGTAMYSFEAGSVNQFLGEFPGLNIIRLAACSGFGDTACYNNKGDTVASITPIINAATAKGIVVEIEDHVDYLYNDPNTLSAANLSNVENWYASLAAAFAGNPYVWFGTPNEPLNSADPTVIAQQELGVYQAIRNAGNSAPVMLELSGGGSPSFAQDNRSYFSSMTDVIWDVHYYGVDTGGNTNQATVTQALANIIAGAQEVQSADGTVPVLIGEYGISGAGSAPDPNAAEVLQTVQQVNAGLGSIAWTWGGGGVDDQATTSTGGTLDAWGQEVATFIATGQTTGY